MAVTIKIIENALRESGLNVFAPHFTGEQPSEPQVSAHMRAIVLCDEVVVVVSDEDPRIGQHVADEIRYAQALGKLVRLTLQPTFMAYEGPLCMECLNPALHVRKTTLAGQQYYCAAHAKIQPDFRCQNAGYLEWHMVGGGAA